MRKIVIAATAGIWLMAACSGSSSVTQAQPSPASSPASSPAGSTPAESPAASGSCTEATATDLTSGPTVKITIQGFAFHPPCFLAKLNGQTLSIVNQDSTAHTFTVDGTSVSLPVAPGQTMATKGSASDVLSAGAHPFHCSIHTSMTGTVILIG